MARKRKYIDRNLLRVLAHAQLSNDEIAVALRVSWDTLSRRYAEAIKKWRLEGILSVRRELFVTAMSPATTPGKMTATIFFLKNFGGMADVTRDENKKAEFGDLPRTEFKSTEVNRPI